MQDRFPVAMDILQTLSALFVVFLGIGLIAVIVIFVIDVTQTTSSVRRNFPVVGRFRFLFEHMGEFFRQYFFAQDREEMPFNRAQRSWVYRASKGIDSTVAFGSTLNLSHPGTPIFVNCPYPVLERDIAETDPMVIGAYARQPYEAQHQHGWQPYLICDPHGELRLCRARPLRVRSLAKGSLGACSCVRDGIGAP